MADNTGERVAGGNESLKTVAGASSESIIAHSFEDFSKVDWKRKAFFDECEFSRFTYYQCVVVLDEKQNEHYLLLMRNTSRVVARPGCSLDKTPKKGIPSFCNFGMTDVKESVDFLNKFLDEVDEFDEGHELELIPMLCQDLEYDWIDIQGRGVDQYHQFWDPLVTLNTSSGRIRIRPCTNEDYDYIVKVHERAETDTADNWNILSMRVGEVRKFTSMASNVLINFHKL